MWFLPPSLPLGPVAVPTFPLALLLALWLWPATSAVMARRLGGDGDAISRAVTLIAVAALAGSRLALFAAYPRDFLATPRALLTVGGPIARWGAAAGALAVLVWLWWRHRTQFFAMLDVAVAAAPLPLAVVALGWSDPAALPAVLGCAVTSLVLFSVKAPPRRGQPLLAATLLLAIVAFAMPSFRPPASLAPTLWFGWTQAQWVVGVIGLVAGLSLWLGERPEPPRPADDATPVTSRDDAGIR